MDLRLLRAFRTVADSGSMSEAALLLNCSGPAISQQIGRLEADLGVTLMERSNSGISLTQAGQRLFELSGSLFGTIEDMREEVRHVAIERTAPIRLEAFASASVRLVPAVIRELRHAGTDAPLTLVELVDDNPYGRVSSGAVTLSIGYVYDHLPIATPDNVVLEVLGRDPMDVIIPSRHPLARRSRVNLSDLRDEDWVFYPSENIAARSVEMAAAQLGFEPRVVFETNDFQVVQALVGAGAGVSLMHRIISSCLPKRSIEVRPLIGSPIGRDVYVAYRRSYDRSRIANVINALSVAFDQATR